MTDSLIDPLRPVVPQLLQLRSPAEYAEWLRTARISAPLRLFESSALEHLTWTAWWLIPCAWLPVAAALLAHAAAAPAGGPSPYAMSALFVSGVVCWSLFEYAMHRFVFHAAPAANGPSITASFLLHGVHHVTPRDEGRLVFPPAPAAAIAALLFASFRALLGESVVSTASFCVIFAGGIVGYVAYDVLHFALHHCRSMDLPVGAAVRSTFSALQARHLAHHARGDANFGVTSPLWDRVFSTGTSSKPSGDEGRMQGAAVPVVEPSTSSAE